MVFHSQNRTLEKLGMKTRGYDVVCRRLGRRIALLRRQRGLTQEDMQRFGFPTRRYQRIEAGQPMSVRTAYRLARALRVTLSQLFLGTMPKEKATPSK